MYVYLEDFIWKDYFNLAKELKVTQCRKIYFHFLWLYLINLGKFKNMRGKYASNASENIFDLRLKISNSSNKEKDVF